MVRVTASWRSKGSRSVQELVVIHISGGGIGAAVLLLNLSSIFWDGTMWKPEIKRVTEALG